jgi:hypothetical protein
MTDRVNGTRAMTIREKTLCGGWTAPRVDHAAAGLGSQRAIVHQWTNARKTRQESHLVPRVQYARRGAGPAVPCRQVAIRQVDREWRVPRRAIQKARETLNAKSATGSRSRCSLKETWESTLSRNPDNIDLLIAGGVNLFHNPSCLEEPPLRAAHRVW